MAEYQVILPVLHPTQKIVKATAKRFNVLNCGRRWGKTKISHEIMVDYLIKGYPIAYTAPTYKMLAEVWRESKELLAPITVAKSEDEHRIDVRTKGSIDFWSLDNPTAMRGRKYKLIINDESASVPGLMEIWETIQRPTLMDLKGDAWFPSTPKGMNDYYKLYLRGMDENDPEWKKWDYTTYDNPKIDPDEIDALKKTMTEKYYKQEILAKFLEGDGVVFRNVENVLGAPKTVPEAHLLHTLVAGVDWGKDNDFTAISIGCVDCRQEVELDRFNTIDYYFQTGRLNQLLAKWRVSRTTVESNSMGTPIIEQLRRDGLQIVSFVTSWKSKTPLIEELALVIEQGTFQFQANDVARAELEAYEVAETELGMKKYSAPKGFFDDTVIARALMYRTTKMFQPNAKVDLYDRRTRALRNFFHQGT